ncbi:MAG: hypothetical protein ABSA47_14225 [Verrucomicrobiota bacterium]|jgi:predicted RNase H-like nuclease (RuvC/YqgF family)
MSTEEQMARLLQQWHQMTRAESRAIQAAAWPRLRAIQSDKARLRQPLSEAMKQWKAQESSAPRGVLSGKPIRAAVSRLIALEERNAQLVAARRQKARDQRLHLERAARNLLRVKKSYAPAAPVAWSSWV